MTELANRRRFDEQIDAEWRRASRTAECVSLLLLDVDNFKKYNDRYGHLEGDQCLRTVAGVLKRAGRRPATWRRGPAARSSRYYFPARRSAMQPRLRRRFAARWPDWESSIWTIRGGVVTVSIGLAA
jgi:GGDEF domain-containing protein